MKGYRFIDPDWEPIRKVLIILGVVGAIIVLVIGVRIGITIFGAPRTNETHELSQSDSLEESDPRGTNNSVSDNDQTHAQEPDSSEPSETSGGFDVSEPTGTPHYTVSHVRDGDTIEVLYDDNQAQAIRLIGVDTPETVHPEKPIECFGPEASDYTKQKLLGRDVGVELDSSQGDYDSHNRVLAYVYLDGENFNLDLIKNGFGYEYTYDAAYKYQKQFKEAEGYAMTRGLGLWSSCENVSPANISAF